MTLEQRGSENLLSLGCISLFRIATFTMLYGIRAPRPVQCHTLY